MKALAFCLAHIFNPPLTSILQLQTAVCSDGQLACNLGYLSQHKNKRNANPPNHNIQYHIRLDTNQA